MSKLSSAKLLGGLGALLSLIGWLFTTSSFGSVVGIIGLIMVFIAVKYIADETKDKSIFDNYLYFFICSIIAIVAMAAIMIYSVLSTIDIFNIEELVKNITDFGAFIDLGGVDGLLHITDMSWSRISHPSEVVAVGDKIEVMVLTIDKESRKVSLGLKQRKQDPWQEIDSRFPVGSRVKGKIVNILPYGVFLELDKGIEGLILGGTELPLILKETDDIGIPWLDTTKIHVESVLKKLL